MLYEKYEARIKKIANILKFIFRNMTKIIICLSVMLCITVALLASKGIVYGVNEIGAQYVYGQSVDIKAKGFLSSVKFQYTPKDSENWSYDVPTKPGEYNVRAQSKALFGYRYSEPQSFVLNAKDLDVKVVDGNVTYGENPELIANTVLGDTVICEDFVYNDTKTQAEINIDALKIMNVNGVDVTDSYNVNAMAGNIKIVNRKITIKTDDINKEYDGTPLKHTEYSLSKGSLAYSDVLTVDFTNSLTNVGKISSAIGYFIVNDLGENVTSKYDVTFIAGKLEVYKRAIEIKTQSLERVYDGKEHSTREYTLENGTFLASGDEISVLNSSTIINAGEKTNELGILILNSSSQNVLANYQITYSYGTLRVLKRDITIKTKTDSKTYDAAYLTNETVEVSLGELCEEQKIVASNWASIIDAESVENTADFEIVDKNGDFTTSNYQISYEYGSLTIQPRALTVTTSSGNALYDGKEHSYEAVAGDDLAGNDIIVVTNYELFVNAGEHQNALEYVINDQNRNADVTNNYQITNNFGTVVIEKRSVTFITETNESYYDGLEHKYENLILGGGDGVAENQHTEIVKITTVSTVCDSIDNVAEINITYGEENVSENYNIEIIYGKLTVLKRPVIIETATNSKIYDAQPLQDTNFTPQNLVEGHEFIVVEYTTITNADTIENEFSKYDVIDINENSVIDNYDVSFTLGMLTVIPRPIILITESAEKIYDATPLTKKGVIIDELLSEYDLVEGHTCKLTNTGTITNYGSVENTHENDLVILSGEDDVTSNYEIVEIKYGTLTVTQRPILVNSNVIKFTYDGLGHCDDTLTANEDLENGYYALCNGHKFNVTACKTFIDYVENEENEIEFTILSSEGDVTSNYKITNNFGDVIVNKKDATVTTGSAEFTYNGGPHSHKEISGEGLIENDEFVILGCPEFVIADEYKNDIRYQIYNFVRGVDVTNNYLITEVIGKVTINKRSITVETNSDQFIYDGAEHAYNNDTDYTIGGLGLANNQVEEISTWTTVRDVVEEKENHLEIIIKDGDGPDSDVTKNYEITYTYGTLTVTPRPILVNSNAIDLTYDGLGHCDYTLTANEDLENGYYALCNDHKFNVTAFKTFIDHVENEENEIKFTIVWGEEDVTKNYKIANNFGEVIVRKKAITVTVEYKEKTLVYNGYEQFYNEVIVKEGLCGNDKIKATSWNSFITVDIYQNPIGYELYNEDRPDANIINNYDITADFGTLEIIKRPIILITESAEKIYNATPLTKKGVIIDELLSEYDLVEGHTCVLENTGTITNVGSTDNTYNTDKDLVILSGEDDVTSNYEIVKIKYGTLTVTPRPILVNSKVIDFTYDGLGRCDDTLTAFEDLENGYYALCNGHEFNVTACKTFIDYVENEKNEIEFTILSSEGDVTSNYQIECNFGDVIVDKRPLTVTTGSAEFTYDGESHSCDEIEGDNLVTQDKIKVIRCPEFVIADEYKNDIDYQIYNFVRDKDVTNNYLITEVIGKVTINKRSITVETNSDKFIYDGAEHEYKDYTIIGGLGLAKNQVDEISTWTTVRDVVEEKENHLEIIIKDGDGPDSNVTKNYEITYTYGTLTVLKRPVIIETATNSKIYDAQPLQDTNFTPQNLVEGHEFIVVEYTTITNADTIENEFSKYDVVDINENSVIDNYDVSFTLGTLTVIPRPIILITESAEKIYDATPLTKDGVKIHESSEYDLVEGHTCKLTNTGTITNYGSVENTHKNDPVILSGEDDVTSNYEIVEIKYGTLTVTKRLIIIETQSAEKYYDGTALTKDVIVISKTSKNDLVEGHKIAANVTGTQTEIGDSQNTIDGEILILSGEGNVTSNYEIENVILGKLEVKKIPIKITTDSAQKEYDGTALTDYDVTVEGSVLDVHSLIIVVNGSQTEVGFSDNFADVSIVVKDTTDDASGYYEITLVLGRLEVTEPDDGEDDEPEKIYITVQPTDLEFAYDGNTHYATDQLIINGLEDIEYYYEVVLNGSQCDVGSSRITIKDFKIFNENGIDITDNYEIGFLEGWITVYGYINVYIYETNVEYDGNSHAVSNDSYYIITDLEGKNIEVEISEINISLKDVGTLSSSDINASISDYITYNIKLNGELTDKYRLYVCSYDSQAEYDVITITPRQIAIKTNSAEKVYDGKPLTDSGFIVNGFVPDGHVVSIAVIGSISSVGYTDNLINMESFMVTDKNGQDVTSNYELADIELGTLTIIS